VNDTTSTPDQPERSGTVATGDQQPDRDPAVVPTHKAGAGAGPAPSTTNGRDAAASVNGSPTAQGDADRDARADQPASATPGDRKVSSSRAGTDGQPEPERPRASPGNVFEAGDEPTARIRLPAASAAGAEGTATRPAPAVADPATEPNASTQPPTPPAAETPAKAPAQPVAKAPAQPVAKAPAQQAAKAPAQPSALPPAQPAADPGELEASRSAPSRTSPSRPSPVPSQPGPSGSPPPGSSRPSSTRPSPGQGTTSRPSPASPKPVNSPSSPQGTATPPWNRVPGKDTPNRQDEPDTNRVVITDSAVGELLDDPDGALDGPTAYIDIAERGINPPAPRREDEEEPATSRSGGWPSARTGRSRPPRQAALQLKRLDPWSVLKLALVLAVVLFFIWLVAVGVLYGVLDGMGVWDRLNGTYADLVSGEADTGSPLISAGRVLGLAAVIGAINSLLFAVAATIAAFVYNVSADLVGGIEVTLSERD
jgi:hypothetical protein